ncbi:hypothetical protein [Methylomonas methanica]|nr:hypothetical protein [Methylomonas methanica]
MASEIGEGKGYAKSLDYAASLSLVPRQHSSSDKHVLLDAAIAICERY